MPESTRVSRRDFLSGSVAAAGAIGLAGAGGMAPAAAPAPGAEAKPPAADARMLPCGTLGKARISRMLLGGNLISGCTHSRDLQYVGKLFHAYMTPEKILQTMKMAEARGINTVFETGANFVQRYNRECGGHMQFIPHIEVSAKQTETELLDHIRK